MIGLRVIVVPVVVVQVQIGRLFGLLLIICHGSVESGGSVRILVRNIILRARAVHGVVVFDAVVSSRLDGNDQIIFNPSLR